MDPIPFDKRSGKIWYNGKLVDWKEANLHILSHGLHYASCVFEGERVYNGEIFNYIEDDSIIPKNGIEFAFNQYLQGIPGKQLTQEISGKVLVPKKSDYNELWFI